MTTHGKRRHSSHRTTASLSTTRLSTMMILIITTTTWLLLATTTSVVSAVNTERETLLLLYNRTLGEQWFNSEGWGDANTPICAWYGVECHDVELGGPSTTLDSGVTALRLGNNNIAHALPPQLWRLPRLKNLELHDNPLTEANLQALPASFAAPLQLLNLANCFLTHVDGLQGAADTLEELRLTRNQLATFPTEVYALTELKKLHLSSNVIMGGSMDARIGQLSNLLEFYAYGNELTGELPKELGNLARLQVLSLSNNLFHGHLPEQLNNLVNLEVLALHGGSELIGNPKSGDFDEDDGEPTTNLGALTGHIPSFANSTKLSKIFLNNNQFAGSLPADFLKFNSAKDSGDMLLINLQDNQLTGGIPVSLWTFPSVHINLVDNWIAQDIPDFLCTKGQWMHGLVGLYDCDAILCPAGWFGGQQSSDDTACRPCPESSVNPSPTYYLGATSCPGLEDDNPNFNDNDDDDGGSGIGNALTYDTTRILLEFYLALDGRRWERNDGWQIFDTLIGKYQLQSPNNPSAGSTSLDKIDIPFPSVSYCNFYGVDCDLQTGHVELISLPNNRLHGTLPSNIMTMPKLLSLDLSNNHVEVTNWSALRHAASLSQLNFAHTQVSTLKGIGKGKNVLTHLFLQGIEMDQQPLPTELFELTLLDTLRLEASDVGGELPSEIANLVNIRRLSLNENQFQGPLPGTAFNNLTKLEYLDLSNNDWTGELPPETGLTVFLENCKNLIEFRLNGARAGLGGPLPSLAGLVSISVVEMAYNAFTGHIPDLFLASARQAQPTRDDITIDLAGNQISGEIPSAFDDFADPLILKLEDNEITHIPNTLCDANNANWMDNEVGTYGCDAILCPPGKWNSRGRASADLQCDQVCPGNLLYWGQSTCVDAAPVDNPERDILDELFVATGGRYWSKNETDDYGYWTDPQAPICTREGVVCGADQNGDSGVTELLLDRFGLRGSIPTSVYELPSLRRLAVTKNPVELSFEGIGNAQNLEIVMASVTKVTKNFTGLEDAGPLLFSLRLNDCGLTGPMPSEFLQIPSLRDLRLSRNQLSGPLPQEGWENMVNLQSLLLDDNNINGQIPSGIGSLEALTELDISGNILSGPLPLELTMMTKLEKLDLSFQLGSAAKLTGPLLDFAEATELKVLDLSHNQLAGNLPTKFLQLLSNENGTSTTVDLSYNQFVGEIPSEWNLLSFVDLNLAANFIDSIPDEICSNLGWMAASGYDNTLGSSSCDWVLCPPGQRSSTGRGTNSETCVACAGGISDSPFYGSVDCDANSNGGTPGGGGDGGNSGGDMDERSGLMAFFEAMEGYEWIHSDNWGSNLNVCTWYGVVCSDDLMVVELRLENNGLANSEDGAEGMGPSDAIAALASVPGLRLLDLKGNSVNLNFESLTPNSNLEVVRISKTDVTSLAGLEKATKLSSLHAMDNGLSGPFPTNILQLSEMTELYLSFNKLNGTLPDTIALLSKLQEMYIYDNELTGQLPESIGQMQELKEVVLGENYFHGQIPSEYSNMGKLEQLALQSQKGKELLDGPLPDFSGAPNLWYLDVSNNDLGSALPSNLLDGSEQKTEPVTLLLRNNDFTGAIPPSLDQFERIFIDLANNRITSIPTVLCDNQGWMNGALAEIDNGCDSILCPVGYYSELGRQDKKGKPCTKCDEDTSGFMGQTSCRVEDSERSILLSFFQETGGDGWEKKEKWTSTEPICAWEGITCLGDIEDDEGVEVINMIDNSLRGTLPSVIFGLPSLQELGLRGNEELVVSLNGIQNAANTLQVLDVSNTKLQSLDYISSALKLHELYADQAGLTGGFPDELLSLPALETLHMNWNFFVGKLPQDIGVQLSGLKYLHLTGNDFHGGIPATIGFMAELEELILDENLMSGVLPSTELSYLPRLRHFSVGRLAKSGRKVRGPLPPFDVVALLESIGLDNNEITGTIPNNFLESSQSVQEVSLGHNNIEGEIPGDLAYLGELRLSLIANEITSVPGEICEANELVSNSGINGTCDTFMCPPQTANTYGREADLNNPCVPCAAGEAPFYGSRVCEVPADERAILAVLFQNLQGDSWTRNDYWLSDASYCDWYGISCDHGHVVGINLASNNLKGVFPKDVYSLPKLQLLWLSSNQIQMGFDGIGKAENLLDLRLGSTGLRSIKGIEVAKSLTFLSVASNDLAGPFPDAILSLENLRYLAMNSNAFSGTIPEDIGLMRFLRYLQLDSNLFSDTVPSFASSLTLTNVHLAGNKLNGDLPIDFLQSIPTSAVVRVDLSNNQIIGQIPEEWGRFDQLSLTLKQNKITNIPSSLCEKESWNDGDVSKYGCNGILCERGKSNLEGRQSEHKPCIPCAEADPEYYGQALCDHLDDTSSSSKPTHQWSFMILVSCAVAVGFSCLF